MNSFCLGLIPATISVAGASMQRFEWPLALLSAFLAAAFLFQGNLHTDDTGIIAGLILVFAAALAFLFRKPGLVFGSLLGLSIVASELWNLKTGIPRAHMAKFSDFVLLFLFVSALGVAGSLAGYGARRAIQRPGPSRT
jgi:hypothetical protein